MTHRIWKGSDGHFHAAVVEQAPYYLALDLPDVQHCHRLRDGNWLLVAFPVWAIDPHSVPAALLLAKEHKGDFGVAIAPFDFPEEVNAAWQESPPNPTGSPAWVFFQNGRRVGALIGVLTRLQLEAEISRHFGPTPSKKDTAE